MECLGDKGMFGRLWTVCETRLFGRLGNVWEIMDCLGD